MLRRLIQAHPKVFAGRAVPLMSSVPAGWYDIADALLSEVEACLSEDELTLLQVASIASRKGRLDVVFIGVYTEMIDFLVDGAGRISQTTCQECGEQPAHFRRYGVDLTLCDFCERERHIRMERQRSLRKR